MVLSTPVNVLEIIGVYIKNRFGCLGSSYPCPVIMNVKTRMCWSLVGVKMVGGKSYCPICTFVHCQNCGIQLLLIIG
jgi:hypothetical protein